MELPILLQQLKERAQPQNLSQQLQFLQLLGLLQQLQVLQPPNLLA